MAYNILLLKVFALISITILTKLRPIYSGKVVKDRTFPYSAIVLVESPTMTCTGVIIQLKGDTATILTAGHCISLEIKESEVLIGFGKASYDDMTWRRVNLFEYRSFVVDILVLEANVVPHTVAFIDKNAWYLKDLHDVLLPNLLVCGYGTFEGEKKSKVLRCETYNTTTNFETANARAHDDKFAWTDPMGMIQGGFRLNDRWLVSMRLPPTDNGRKHVTQEQCEAMHSREASTRPCSADAGAPIFYRDDDKFVLVAIKTEGPNSCADDLTAFDYDYSVSIEAYNRERIDGINKTFYLIIGL
uniref:CSON013330 protein n=1 Tax=Culicoides sonorensis TaxID=179676 RepID=A0A336KMB9_CULSO